MNAFVQIWKSKWTGWVGFRYLRSKQNSRFLSMITVISILGVGLGVTAMIVVLSVMGGFEAELKKRLMGSEIHILVRPTPQARGFDRGLIPESSLDQAGLLDAIRRERQVLDVEPVVQTEAILRTGRKVTGVVAKGVRKEKWQRLRATLTESLDPLLMAKTGEGEASRPSSVLVGRELANELGILAGDFVTLVSPTETEGPFSTVPRMKRFVVEGVYQSGLPEQELNTVFTMDQGLRAFLRRAGVLSSVEVSVKDFSDAPAIARSLAKRFPEYQVQDWREMNAQLFASLRLERIAMFVILAFIIVVASFNIVTTLTLMVLEKKREIAILRAMGAQGSEVAAVFLSEGIFIGALGLGGGILLAFALCSVLKRYEFIQLPEIYYDRTLPVVFEAWIYGGVAICALLIVLAACIYPSRRASRVSPLDGIRFG